jgi:hypothetical protein
MYKKTMAIAATIMTKKSSALVCHKLLYHVGTIFDERHADQSPEKPEFPYPVSYKRILERFGHLLGLKLLDISKESPLPVEKAIEDAMRTINFSALSYFNAIQDVVNFVFTYIPVHEPLFETELEQSFDNDVDIIKPILADTAGNSKQDAQHIDLFVRFFTNDFLEPLVKQSKLTWEEHWLAPTFSSKESKEDPIAYLELHSLASYSSLMYQQSLSLRQKNNLDKKEAVHEALQIIHKEMMIKEPSLADHIQHIKTSRVEDRWDTKYENMF